MLEHYEGLAPRLSSRLRCYEVLIFISALAGTLLGALNGQEWIPVAVALSSVLTHFLQYEGLQSRLVAVNSAITDLNALHAQWRSFGVVEKRMRSTRNLIVGVTENAILREAQTYA